MKKGGKCSLSMTEPIALNRLGSKLVCGQVILSRMWCRGADFLNQSWRLERQRQVWGTELAELYLTQIQKFFISIFCFSLKFSEKRNEVHYLKATWTEEELPPCKEELQFVLLISSILVRTESCISSLNTYRGRDLEYHIWDHTSVEEMSCSVQQDRYCWPTVSQPLVPSISLIHCSC